MTSRLARKCLKRSTHQLRNTQSVQQIRTRLVPLFALAGGVVVLFLKTFLKKRGGPGEMPAAV